MPHRLRRIAACCFALVASCVGEGAVEPIPAPFHPPQEERTSLARPAVLPTRPTPARPPPPLSGGTLLALRDDLTLVASDPDHDALWIARHREDAPARRVALRAGDEPGRLVEDAAGRVHVVLRRGGAVATVDPARGVVTARREVCPAPRGIAWDATRAQLYVACEGGEFVVLPAEGSATARHALVDDLRDVLVVEGAVYVSRFRKGTVHVVDPARGTTTPMPTPSMAFNATPSTAWRLADAGGAVAMLSQAVQPIPLRVGAPGVPTPPSNSAYGTLGSVRLPVTPTVHVQNTSSRGMELAVLLPDGGLTIDLAGQRDEGGRRIAIASPGWAFGQGIAQVREWTITPNQPVVSLASRGRPVDVPGQAVAVAYTPAGWLAVQTRAPGALVVRGRTIPLYDDAVADTGHDVFHVTTASGLACASCHPEGGDDGRVWQFVPIGNRRTPSLRGGIGGTAPFHWDGDMRDIAHLADEVFTARMGGVRLATTHTAALGRWIDTVPAVPRAAVDRDAVARGEALFRDATVGCATCHGGARYTNNATMDVGTGGRFQVPPLVGLAGRAPFMHTGCAATLTERFTNTSCGGGDAHGRTSQLDAAQIGDLVAYLATL